MITILVCTVYAGSARAADYYVRPAGGNYGLENGSSYENAWDGFADIAWGEGVGSVEAGDTLFVAGTHRETLMIGESGKVENHIFIKSCELTMGANTDDPVINIPNNLSFSPNSFNNAEITLGSNTNATISGNKIIKKFASADPAGYRFRIGYKNRIQNINYIYIPSMDNSNVTIKF